MKKQIIADYHNSETKRVLDLAMAFFGLVSTLPLILIISLIIKLTSPGPAFFIQKRVGKNGKIFKIIKFRTMIWDAEKQKSRYLHLNEADGPVFKIYNDPRYTRVGKLLAMCGLDELPQFINVLRGEMSLIGPRPLPTYEAGKLTSKQKIREQIKPGITSSWVVSGSHQLKFRDWMKLDEEYVKKASFSNDLEILTKTTLFMLRQLVKQISDLLNS